MDYTLTLPASIRRAEVAKLIAQATGTEARYLKAPSMAYQIGQYRLTRDAHLEGPELTEQLRQVLTSRGVTITAPEKEVGLAIMVPAASLGEQGRDNLTALMRAYGPLIARALSLPAPAGVEYIRHEDAGLVARFAWFTTLPDAEVASACQDFITALVAMAMTARRVRGRAPQSDNDRYAMRTFLNRLGLSGDEHKATRRVLTRNLEGNGAWRTPPAPKTPAVQEGQGVRPGCRIRLLGDSDTEAGLRAGMEGDVIVVDSLGTIHVAWDDGTSLGLIPEVDHYQVLG
ncbi:DUF4314 domain-containing protein [Corynebacterium auriscanis]|uniref:DUF4314 domain-containing protein n=1 Tax=Corynebacterium auriscanis TaxID=99807 RepID=UPI003CF95ECF